MDKLELGHKQKCNLAKSVLVAMSGGVDSSVAALLLQQKGFNISGAYMKNWTQDSGIGTCPWESDQRDARMVAARLNIPFYTFDFEDEYREKVVEYMIAGYKMGVTPNPDTMCNKEIKFKLFLEKAVRLGFDYIATGHYAKIRESRSSGSKVVNRANRQMRYRLLCAKDKNKDQSYFLYSLTQKQLRYCFFPIGEYNKKQIRDIAKKNQLITAYKKDSQGICFIGEIDLTTFLRERIKDKIGKIVTQDGQVIGNHKGAHLYTIGQRRGICVSDAMPYYVVDKNIKTNTLIVGSKDDPGLQANKCYVVDINWINGVGYRMPLRCQAKIRYRQEMQDVDVQTGDNATCEVIFDTPQRAITPGQAIVFYKAAEMLGGGTIRGEL